MKIQQVNGIGLISPKKSQKSLKNEANNNTREQIKELSNIYYKPISFSRSWKEHESWGGRIDPKTKEASFKILTYPDTKKVVVTVKKRNDEKQTKDYVLENKGKGIFETAEKIPAGEVEHGDKYFFTIYKGNGDVDKVKDPYSLRQETLMGESTMYDNSMFKWSDHDWMYNYNKKRITANKYAAAGIPVSHAKIYEINIPTFTNKGTFEAAKKMLNSVVESGFNAVELMPVENTYSYNWGYDGVDKLAVSEHMGGPDGLKSFVDYAHSIGLNVIMDIVPNHLGPDGASLRRTGPFIEGENCFGEKFNYEGKNNEYVRDFIVNAAINWANNFHCDGLRFDMTPYMESDNTMKQIAAELKSHCPNTFLIAEDSRSGVSVDGKGHSWSNPDEVHDKRITSPLEPQDTGTYNISHEAAIQNIANNESNLSRLGYNSVWDFNFYHNLKECIYGIGDLDKFDKAVLHAQDSVKYIMSHDEIGNFEGTRLIPKLMVPMLNLNENMVLDSKDRVRAKKYSKDKNCEYDEALRTISVQKAQFAAEKLVMMLQTGLLDKYDTKNIDIKRWINAVNDGFKKEVLIPLGINEHSGITYDRVAECFQKCFNKNKMALARTYAIPGPKMVFQGDDRIDMTPFRFFRKFSNGGKEEKLATEKGYDTGYSAFYESKMGHIPYSAKGRSMMNKFRNLTKDLNKLVDDNPALTQGHIQTQNTIKNQAAQVYATHIKDPKSGNELFVITNFMDTDYPKDGIGEYYIEFPQGYWDEVINTDDKKYGGSGNFMNGGVTTYYTLDKKQAIKLPAQSTLIFRKYDPIY